jgi:NADP-dependent 3-hydroxy acid dehydrogenase YdfG
LAARPNPPTQAEQALMLQAEDVATAALFAAALPPRATICEMTIVPTDNKAWRSYAYSIAKA